MKRALAGSAFVVCVVAGACASFKTGATSGGGDAGGSVSDAGEGGVSNDTTFSIVQQISTASPLNAIWGSGPADIHAVGDNGAIYDYDGKTWTALGGSQTGATLSGVWGTGPNDIYAVGVLAADARGIIFHNDGTGWVQQTSTATGLLSVWGTAGTVYAVGLGGHIYQKVGSADWTDVGHLPPNPYVDAGADAPVLWSIYGNGADNIVLAADLDTTYRNDGLGWIYSYDPVDRTRNYRSVWGAPSETLDVYMGANYFGIWWWAADEDGGTQEVLLLNEERDTPDKAGKYIWGIWGPSSDRIVFVGDDGRIMWFDGGENGPKIVPSPVSVTLSGVWGTSLDDVWIVGDQGTILHGSIPQ